MWLTSLWIFCTRAHTLQSRILGDATAADVVEGERPSLSLVFRMPRSCFGYCPLQALLLEMTAREFSMDLKQAPSSDL